MRTRPIQRNDEKSKLMRDDTRDRGREREGERGGGGERERGRERGRERKGEGGVKHAHRQPGTQT